MLKKITQFGKCRVNILHQILFIYDYSSKQIKQVNIGSDIVSGGGIIWYKKAFIAFDFKKTEKKCRNSSLLIVKPAPIIDNNIKFCIFANLYFY